MLFGQLSRCRDQSGYFMSAEVPSPSHKNVTHFESSMQVWHRPKSMLYLLNLLTGIPPPDVKSLRKASIMTETINSALFIFCSLSIDCSLLRGTSRNLLLPFLDTSPKNVCLGGQHKNLNYHSFVMAGISYCKVAAFPHSNGARTFNNLQGIRLLLYFWIHYYRGDFSHEFQTSTPESSVIQVEVGLYTDIQNSAYLVDSVSILYMYDLWTNSELWLTYYRKKKLRNCILSQN